MRRLNSEEGDDVGALVRDVEAARARFLDLFDDLDAEAVDRPVGEGRWSPAEYLEHVVLAEEATLWRMFKAVDDARASGRVVESPTPGATIEELVERTWQEREVAPPLAVPRLGGPAAYWAVRLRRNRALVEAFGTLVAEAELDALAYPHPISGPFTLRQGLAFVRFHLDRHAAHVEEAPGAVDGSA